MRFISTYFPKYGSLTQWNYVFLSSSLIYVFGLIFFLIFGTAKAQPWGIIEGRSRRATTSSSYKASAPQTPRSGVKDAYNANGIVFTIKVPEPDNFESQNEFKNEEQYQNEEKEEEFDNLHYFKERRFSIFPIS
jgi:hypothetical protein